MRTAGQQGHMTRSCHINFFVGSNLCLLFLALRHSHVSCIQGSSFSTDRSPCSASLRPLCASPTHELGLNHPSCQDQEEGQDGLSWGQTCQCDGLLGNVRVGSTHASCLDDVVVAWVAPYGIMWKAYMPSADVRTATPPSLASLDQGWLGHSIRDKV